MTVDRDELTAAINGLGFHLPPAESARSPKTRPQRQQFWAAMLLLASMGVGIRRTDLRTATGAPMSYVDNAAFYWRRCSVWTGGDGRRGSGPGTMHYTWPDLLEAQDPEGEVAFVCDALVGSGDLVRYTRGDDLLYRVRLLGDYSTVHHAEQPESDLVWRSVADDGPVVEVPAPDWRPPLPTGARPGPKPGPCSRPINGKGGIPAPVLVASLAWEQVPLEWRQGFRAGEIDRAKQRVPRPLSRYFSDEFREGYAAAWGA